jgi:hypothetical protein
MLRIAYSNIQKLGEKLVTDEFINWEKFRPIVKAIYHNNTKRAGFTIARLGV